MFIIATNDTDNTDLTMAALLEHYKGRARLSLFEKP